MDTERRMTTQEMLAQHRKLMDEAQRLEPSVMVTERNWSALLEMQDEAVPAADAAGRGPENAPDAGGRTGAALTEMQDECRGIFEKQAGSLSARYSSICKALTEITRTALPDRDPERYEAAAFEYGAGDAKKKIRPLRVDLDYSGDLVRGAVRLGRAVEQMTDDVQAQYDGTTMPAAHRQQAPERSSGKRKPPSVTPRTTTRIGHMEQKM